MDEGKNFLEGFDQNVAYGQVICNEAEGVTGDIEKAKFASWCDNGEAYNKGSIEEHKEDILEGDDKFVMWEGNSDYSEDIESYTDGYSQQARDEE